MTLPLDFDRIRADRAGAIVLDGATHAVKQMTAASLGLIASATSASYLETAATIVARLVPTLTAEQRADLSVAEIEAILGLANADIAAVRKLDPTYQEPDPNGQGPATDPPSPA